MEIVDKFRWTLKELFDGLQGKSYLSAPCVSLVPRLSFLPGEQAPSVFAIPDAPGVRANRGDEAVTKWFFPTVTSRGPRGINSRSRTANGARRKSARLRAGSSTSRIKKLINKEEEFSLSGLSNPPFWPPPSASFRRLSHPPCFCECPCGHLLLCALCSSVKQRNAETRGDEAGVWGPGGN